MRVQWLENYRTEKLLAGFISVCVCVCVRERHGQKEMRTELVFDRQSSFQTEIGLSDQCNHLVYIVYIYVYILY